MKGDRVIGIILLLAAILGVFAYIWLFWAGFGWYVVAAVVSVFALSLLLIIAWVGWVIATTPSPQRLEDTTMGSDSTAGKSAK